MLLHNTFHIVYDNNSNDNKNNDYYKDLNISICKLTHELINLARKGLETRNLTLKKNKKEKSTKLCCILPVHVLKF